MSVCVLIPWLNGSSEIRERNLSFVLELYRECFDGWRLRVLTTSDRPFNKAKLINRAVRGSRSETDIFVLNDADSICDPAQIEHAAAWASAEPGLVFAYTTYGRLDETQTRALQSWDDCLDRPLAWEMQGSGSTGCCAIRRACYLELGGMDERYAGWGYEDLDFVNRAGGRWPLRRVPGDLNHLWHGERRADDSPDDSDPADVARNLQLYGG